MTDVSTIPDPPSPMTSRVIGLLQMYSQEQFPPTQLDAAERLGVKRDKLVAELERERVRWIQLLTFERQRRLIEHKPRSRKDAALVAGFHGANGPTIFERWYKRVHGYTFAESMELLR